MSGLPEQHVPVERLALPKWLSAKAWSHFVDPPAGHIRYRFSTSAVLLAHEHHSSVVHLVEGKRFASACALLRPLLEAAITATWSLYVAPATKLQALLEGHGRIPDLRSMVDKIEVVEGVGDQGGWGEMLREHARLFHAFAHGDVEQLKRRFGIGPDRTTYTRMENYGTLVVADVLMLWAVGVMAALSSSSETSDFVAASLRHVVASAREEHADLGLPERFEWRPFPQPALDELA